MGDVSKSACSDRENRGDMLACPSKVGQFRDWVACTDNVVTVWFGNRAIRQEPWNRGNHEASFFPFSSSFITFTFFHSVS